MVASPLPPSAARAPISQRRPPRAPIGPTNSNPATPKTGECWPRLRRTNGHTKRCRKGISRLPIRLPLGIQNIKPNNVLFNVVFAAVLAAATAAGTSYLFLRYVPLGAASADQERVERIVRDDRIN